MVMKKIFYIFILIFIIFSLINLPFWTGVYEKYFLKNTINYKLNLLDNMSTSPEIILFGSSNSEQGLNATILEREYSKLLNKDVTVFNFSIPAAMYLEKLYLLKYLVSKGKKPKLIILHYVPKIKLIYDKDIFYASYFTYDKALNIADLYDLSKSYVGYKSLLDFYFAYVYKPYLYRGVLFDSISEFYDNIKQGKDPQINFSGQRTRYSIRGDLESKFVPSELKFEQKNEQLITLMKQNYEKPIEFSDKHQYSFNRIIEYAKANNIGVLITNIPEVLDFSRTEESSIYVDYFVNENKKIYEKYAEEKGIYFIDLIGNNKFNLFDSVDGHHLTYNTSVKLTKLLADKLFQDGTINEIFINNAEKNSQGEETSDSLLIEKNMFHKIGLLKRYYENNIIINKNIIIKLMQADNDYLSLSAMDYLFKFFPLYEIELLISEQLDLHKRGGPYNIARFENILKNLSQYNIKLSQQDIERLSNLPLDDFIRVNAIIKYLHVVDLDGIYTMNYIDNILMKLDNFHIENVDTIIQLYHLIVLKGANDQKDKLIKILRKSNMKQLILYLENNMQNNVLL